jgi:hypothetical protein
MNDQPKQSLGNFDMDTCMETAVILADFLAENLMEKLGQFKESRPKLVDMFEPEFFNLFITSLSLMVMIAFMNNNKEASDVIPKTLKMVMDGVFEGSQMTNNPVNLTIN